MKIQILNLRIDWGDQDLLGHVNNVSIVRYLQAGRVMFMENIGLPAYLGMKTGPIEAATEIQFRKQLRFPGNVRVFTAVREVKNTSIVLDHQIYDDAGDLAVSAMEVIVHFDFVNQTKIPLTDQLRENIRNNHGIDIFEYLPALFFDIENKLTEIYSPYVRKLFINLPSAAARIGTNISCIGIEPQLILLGS